MKTLTASSIKTSAKPCQKSFLVRPNINPAMITSSTENTSYNIFNFGLSLNSVLNNLPPLFFSLFSRFLAHLWLLASSDSPPNSSGIPPGPGSQPSRAEQIIKSTPMKSVATIFSNDLLFFLVVLLSLFTLIVYQKSSSIAFWC